MTAPNWQTIPGMWALAEQAKANGLEFSQAKLDRLWDISEAAGVPPFFMLAILPAEGTGSFDTKPGAGGDGGGGIEPDWEVDVQRAVDLVAGKLALYPQAMAQGFGYLCMDVTSPGDGQRGGYPADGKPDQFVNWTTAILRPSGEVHIGCYAQHGSWWVNVRRAYLRFGGKMADLIKATEALDKRAPRVKLSMQVVTDSTGLASNWNATAPEPAVIVTRAQVTAPPTKWPIIPVWVNGGDGRIGGRTLRGELRDGTAWVTISGIDMPLRAVAETLGNVVEYVPKEKGGPGVRVRGTVVP